MDTPTLNFKFEINLKKFAAVSVATILWDNEKIKHDIKDYFGDFKNKTKDNWYDVTNKVSNHSKKLPLPKELLIKLDDYITATGYLVLRWNEYLRNVLNVSAEFADKIYWTNRGTIDENKIFQMYWEKMPWFIIDNTMDTFYNHNIIALSCIFAQENYITKNYKQIREITISNVDSGKILSDKCDTLTVIALWVCIYLSKSKQKGINRYRRLKSENSVSSFLYFQCIVEELYDAAKYFWQHMDEIEKDFCYNCHDLVRYNLVGGCNRCYDSYLNSKNTELLIYFLNNMSDDSKDEFLRENLVDIFHHFKEWPYQEMLEMILDKYIDAASVHIIESFFLDSVQHISEDHEKFVDKDLYRQILPKILKNIPKEIKYNKLKNKEPPFKDVFQAGHVDVSILSTIFNDKDLEKHKDELTDIHQLEFKNFVNSDDFDKLIKFSCDVFPLKSDRKEFMLKMNIATTLAIEGQFCLVDELLDWISDSDTEKNELRDQIDPLEVCSANPSAYSIHIIRRFFEWRYDTDEEREEAKVTLRHSDFFFNKMVKILSEENDEDREEEFAKWAEILFWFWNLRLS